MSSVPPIPDDRPFVKVVKKPVRFFCDFWFSDFLRFLFLCLAHVRRVAHQLIIRIPSRISFSLITSQHHNISQLPSHQLPPHFPSFFMKPAQSLVTTQDLSEILLSLIALSSGWKK